MMAAECLIAMSELGSFDLAEWTDSGDNEVDRGVPQ